VSYFYDAAREPNLFEALDKLLSTLLTVEIFSDQPEDRVLDNVGSLLTRLPPSRHLLLGGTSSLKVEATHLNPTILPMCWIFEK
jgi:hypothetical protein